MSGARYFPLDHGLIEYALGVYVARYTEIDAARLRWPALVAEWAAVHGMAAPEFVPDQEAVRQLLVKHLQLRTEGHRRRPASPS